jgi:hypothetical protein
MLPREKISQISGKKYKAAGAPTAQTLKHNTSVNIFREGLKKDIELYKANHFLTHYSYVYSHRFTRHHRLVQLTASKPP